MTGGIELSVDVLRPGRQTSRTRLSHTPRVTAGERASAPRSLPRAFNFCARRAAAVHSPMVRLQAVAWRDAGPGVAMPAEVLLFTPEQAVDLLGVKPSWLRRKAAARAVPCTFVGKHLRFSRADLEAIVTAGEQAPRTRPTCE